MTHKLMSSLTFFSLAACAVYADAPKDEENLFAEFEQQMSVSTSSPTNSTQIVDTNQAPPSSDQNTTTLVVVEVDEDNQEFPVQVNTVYAGKPFLQHSINMKVDVDYLLWTTGANDLAYGATGSNGDYALRQYHKFDREWTSGFRAGAEYAFSAQGWDVGLSYTRIVNGTISALHKQDNAEIFLTWSTNGAILNVADQTGGVQEGHWHLHYQQADANFGKEFFVSKYYSLRPSAGVRYVNYNAHFTVSNTAPSTNNYTDILEQDKVNAFGLNFGVDNSFHFGYGLSLKAAAGVGIMYGPKRISYKAISATESGGAYTYDGFRVSQSCDDILPMLDAALSLNWRKSFCNDSFGLGIGVGYEYHAIVDGFTAMEMLWSNGIVDLSNQQSTLYMQGLTASVSFSF